ncbi:MAG TPA: AMP-binding protein [Allosphingosinicella sp.]|jgi:fatty-acyl-CoA synthase
MIAAAFPDLLSRRAQLTPDAPALEEAVGGRTATYAQLDRAADGAAGLLVARGISPGDRVAVLCRGRIGFFELLFACARIGAVLVPLNWRMPAAELGALMDDCTPSLLVHGKEEAGLAQAVGSARGLPLLSLDQGFDALAEKAAVPPDLRREWAAGQVWYLIYTSGTTGRPRGVIYTCGMALANYVNIGAAIGLTAVDTTLSFLPHFHTAGINLHALPTLIEGGRVLLLPAFDSERVVALLEARRVDTVFAVPTVYQALLDHPRFADAPLGHVRHWGCGGAPLSAAVLARARALGLRLCNGMGMTETGPTMFLQDPADCWKRPGSVGKPQLLCRARVTSADGRALGVGEVGELHFRGAALTPGYWANPEATSAAFTADGWLRSGDLGWRDAEGHFYIAGRGKEMFISGGENVYPAEVENVLAGHPAVIEAAVIAAPHPEWGEVGRAFIQVMAGSNAPGQDDLEDYCRSRLAAYKVPKSFEFVPEFPRTAAGKVQKHLLR